MKRRNKVLLAILLAGSIAGAAYAAFCPICGGMMPWDHEPGCKWCGYDCVPPSN